MPNLALVMTPPLREGDRLTSKEFIKRWQGMPELKHAELINGIVYCMSYPLSLSHSDAHFDMIFWLGLYLDSTPGCGSGPDMPQPDIYLRILPEYGGQSTEAGGYGKGAPELIVEVSGSTLSRDLGAKLELYRQAGVREYITVLLNPRQVIWRQLMRGRYRNIAPRGDGLLCSPAFPGLWLDPETLWSKKKSIRKAVEKGLKSPEHTAFVKRLASALARGQ